MDDRAEQRARMVERQIAARGVTDPALLAAMREVPREAFVAPQYAHRAYRDGPLPIELGQTISQPYIVALMIEAARVGADDHVLEVGCGSGYAAAILGRVARSVVTIERYEALADAARRRLAELDSDNVTVRTGDGWRGCPDQAPFDAILVAAAADRVPPALLDQLAIGGRLVIPVGTALWGQQLLLVERTSASFERTKLAAVRFVPLIEG